MSKNKIELVRIDMASSRDIKEKYAGILERSSALELFNMCVSGIVDSVNASLSDPGDKKWISIFVPCYYNGKFCFVPAETLNSSIQLGEAIHFHLSGSGEICVKELSSLVAGLLSACNDLLCARGRSCVQFSVSHDWEITVSYNAGI